ncbi:hypothetical protein ACWD4N_48750, partial [Streptomyces sp. NPDC002586]
MGNLRRVALNLGSDVRIAAVGTWLPAKLEYTERVVQEQRLDPRTAASMGVSAVTVADGIATPDMAVKAAECALQRAGWRAEDVNLLIHSWLYYQGHELWSPPHYIAHRLGAVNCLPMAIHQGCDGGALALQDAVLRLSGQPGIGKALVTSADRFTAPAVDRWNCQPSMALGDGATAIALERGPVGNSPFSLLSLATASLDHLAPPRDAAGAVLRPEGRDRHDPLS